MEARLTKFPPNILVDFRPTAVDFVPTLVDSGPKLLETRPHSFRVAANFVESGHSGSTDVFPNSTKIGVILSDAGSDLG